MARKNPKKKHRGWGWMILLLVISIGFFFVGCVSFLISTAKLPLGNVASIPIKGIILMDGTQTTFGEKVAAASEIVDFIKQAEDNDLVKAIILDINSPGGSAVASMEIAEAVKKAEKPVVVVIREIGTSGAYWVASAADMVIARDLSITGSIGVIGSYIELAGLLHRFNLTYRRLIAGERKDLGTPYRELQPDEEKIIQGKLDFMHKVFITHVAENRNLSFEHVKALADGSIYLGAEAIELGLIDRIGSYDDGVAYIEDLLNITVEISEYKHVPSLLEALTGVFSENSYYIGRGVGDSLKTRSNQGLQMFT